MSRGRIAVALAFLAILSLAACSDSPAEPLSDGQTAHQFPTAIEGSDPASARPGPGHLILSLADELGLTSSQRSAIESLADEHRQARRAALREVRRVLTEEQSRRLREILSEGIEQRRGDGFPRPEIDGSPGADLPGGPTPMLRVLDLADELDLTRQQIAELETILSELQEVTREIREAIRSVLTPAQLDRLEELLRQGRGPRGGLHGGG